MLIIHIIKYNIILYINNIYCKMFFSIVLEAYSELFIIFTNAI